MSLFRRTPEQRRQRAYRRVSGGPLGAYLAAPLASPETPLTDLPLLAVDIETTGLDPRTDRLLSIGFVPVDGTQIVLGGARHILVAGGGGPVGQSATIHGLTDDILSTGVGLTEAVAELLDALTGRVLLAHFARIETGFLGTACERLWGAGMPCATVDTFELQRRLITQRWGSEIADGALRLWTARGRYGLPAYPAHEALTDAIACAELYLAQVAELAAADQGRADKPLTLGQVLS